MKIAFIVPHLEDGGMPKLVSTMTGTWKDFHDIAVILLIAGMEKNYSIDGRIVELCPIGGNVFGKALSVVKRIHRAKQLCRAEKFDAVISFGSAANAVNVLSHHGGRVILTEHNIKSRENASWGIAGRFYNAVIRFLYNRADAVVAISRAMKDDLESFYGVKNCVLIHNPHDLKGIAQKGAESFPPDLAFLKRERYIFAAGPTDERKGFLHLVRSFAIVKDVIPSVKLVIAGKQGPLHEAILREAESLGLSKDVIFAGYLTNPYPLMAKAALFACSSLREGLPNVIVESLALGVPVVSTDCISGPREILQMNPADDGSASDLEIVDCGALVPVFVSSGDIPSREENLFAKALCTLLYDELLYKRMKKSSLKRSRDFSSDVIMSRYESLCAASPESE
jgi:glycosyltransferase involved in cell wall biosynthesis